MGRLEQRKRNKENKKRRSIIAIGCEGKNKTESIYFENFSSRKCIIKFSTGNNTDPLGMVEDLVKFMKKEDISTKYDDKIYLLLDTDINQNKQEQIDKVKAICNENGIELITSIPTFEFWYILHFRYTTKAFNSSIQVKKEISKDIKDYNESMNVYPIIKDNTDKAIERAKKIEDFHVKNEQDTNNENCNPYTGVYKVVIELIRRNKEKIIDGEQ